MPTLTITKNYADGTTLTKAHLDSALDSITTFTNSTKLDSANIQAGGIATSNLADAAVTSSKIASAAVTGTALDTSCADASTLEVVGGTTRIKDGGVTTAKIATANVTAAKLPDNINLNGKGCQVASASIVTSATPASNGLYMIRGWVQGNHTATKGGEGWTVVANNPGDYTITFSTAFGDTPTVVASGGVGGNGGNAICYVNSVSTTSVNLFTYSGSGGGLGYYSFNFIAIGQRA